MIKKFRGAIIVLSVKAKRQVENCLKLLIELNPMVKKILEK